MPFVIAALVVSAAVSPTVQAAAALSPRIANSTGGAEITYSSKGSDVQYPVTLGGVNLLSASALEISAALEAGKFTSVELVDAYLARVDANDRKGLKLRGLIEVAPTARDIAQELDNERSNGTTRSKLHGIPIAIKDSGWPSIPPFIPRSSLNIDLRPSTRRLQYRSLSRDEHDRRIFLSSWADHRRGRFRR